MSGCHTAAGSKCPFLVAAVGLVPVVLSLPGLTVALSLFIGDLAFHCFRGYSFDLGWDFPVLAQAIFAIKPVRLGQFQATPRISPRNIRPENQHRPIRLLKGTNRRRSIRSRRPWNCRQERELRACNW